MVMSNHCHLALEHPSRTSRSALIRGAYSVSWAIGTEGWKRALAKEYAQTRLAPEWGTDELDRFRQDRRQHELESGLAEVGRTLTDAANSPKLVHRKLELARRLRHSVAVPYRWIADILVMGSPSSVRAALCHCRQRSAG